MNVQTQLGNSRKTQNLCGIKGEKRKEKFVIPFSLKQRNKEKGKKFNGTQTSTKKGIGDPLMRKREINGS